MDFLQTKVGGLRRSSSKRASTLGSFKPKTPREIYYLYKDEFGFLPQQPKHLVQFAKQKDYILKHKKAEELLNDPPDPPTKKLPNGQYKWSDSESNSDSEIDDDIDIDLDVLSPQKKETTQFTKNIIKLHNISELQRTQLVLIHGTNMGNAALDLNPEYDTKDDTVFHDESGYNLQALTNNIIIYFHLDISLKQWPKWSRTFLDGLNDVLHIKRSDYNILTVCKNITGHNGINISIVLKKSITIPNHVFLPLMKSFKDSSHLLKMLKKLQFSDIDKSGKNQVDRREFDLYFNENSVEPLDKQVLTNLFNTLDEDGDGEITVLEFFKWKNAFNAKTLANMFPIIKHEILQCNSMDNITNLSKIYSNVYNQLQDFPFELSVQSIFKMQSDRKMKSSNDEKMLFLVYKHGISESDINAILGKAVGKKGQFFDDKGMYGQGYYLTSNIQFALHHIVFNQEVSNRGPLRGGHKIQLSTQDFSGVASGQSDKSEYCILLCLCNLGKINYIRDFQRSKKIKGSFDTNCIQRLIGDWNDVNIFGKPADAPEYNSYNGNVYDCYIVKDYRNIMPKYILSLKRIHKCFIWMDSDIGKIKQFGNKLIFNRLKLKKDTPNIIYISDNNDRVITLIRLKMQFNCVYLMRFVGLDVNVGNTMGNFIKYIRGNLDNISVFVYPITILFNINTQKQIWNLIFRDDIEKKLLNIRGSPNKIFEYIYNNKTNDIKCVSVIVISIKFVKTQKHIKNTIKQQIKDTKNLEKEFNEDPNYYFDKKHRTERKYSDEKEANIGMGSPQKSFRIQITGADKQSTNSSKKKKQSLLNGEKIHKLLALNLPIEVEQTLQNPKQYSLPLDEKESMANLERDISLMEQGLHNQSINQRKYSKLAILKWYNCLYEIYKKYCTLGGDAHWLTLEGFKWMLFDANIADKDNVANSYCTNDALEQLFHITYKMHHRLVQKKSKKASEDEWSGMWIPSNTYDTGSPTSLASTPTNRNDVYKLRKIGDLRLLGCVNSRKYGDIHGSILELNDKKCKLIVTYKQRKKAGKKRIWNCELVQKNKMKISWVEIEEKGKGGSQKKKGKFHIEKINSLANNDSDLPKDQFIGLSRHEFFDCILSIALTKHGLDLDHQFQCIDKLCADHFNALFQNIVANKEAFAVAKNKMYKKTGVLRKLFKIYAALDSDDSADDDLMGEEEFITFAMELCKTMKTINKKVWSLGGKPSFNEMKASFILDKNEDSENGLQSEEIDYIHFEKCIVNLTNVMFKHTGEGTKRKYKLLTFDQKLDLVLAATNKMSISAKTKKRDSGTLKKVKKLRAESTPKDSDGTPISFPNFSPSTKI